jgi:Flp pilus assembly pilin Flp
MRAQNAMVWLGSVLAGLAERLERDERGSAVMEYLGIGAVVVVLVTAVVGSMEGVGEQVGEAIGGFIETIVGLAG